MSSTTYGVIKLAGAVVMPTSISIFIIFLSSQHVHLVPALVRRASLARLTHVETQSRRPTAGLRLQSFPLIQRQLMHHSTVFILRSPLCTIFVHHAGITVTSTLVTLCDFTLWISLSLRPNFGLRPNLIQKVKWRFWFGLCELLSRNFRLIAE